MGGPDDNRQSGADRTPRQPPPGWARVRMGGWAAGRLPTTSDRQGTGAHRARPSVHRRFWGRQGTGSTLGPEPGHHSPGLAVLSCAAWGTHPALGSSEGMVGMRSVTNPSTVHISLCSKGRWRVTGGPERCHPGFQNSLCPCCKGVPMALMTQVCVMLRSSSMSRVRALGLHCQLAAGSHTPATPAVPSADSCAFPSSQINGPSSSSAPPSWAPPRSMSWWR